MTITLNGKPVELDKELTLNEFLALKGLEPEKIVVECNYEIVKRDTWDSIILKEKDNLEVLRFVGGG